jgi:hypothetical protein
MAVIVPRLKPVVSYLHETTSLRIKWLYYIIVSKLSSHASINETLSCEIRFYVVFGMKNPIT